MYALGYFVLRVQYNYSNIPAILIRHELKWQICVHAGPHLGILNLLSMRSFSVGDLLSESPAHPAF